MIHTPLERPPDIRWRCKLCDGEMIVRHHWLFGRWLHPTVHERCADQRPGKTAGREREIPERFREFNPGLADAEALRIAQGFTPDSKLKTLIIVGVPSRGKSRLMWAIVGQFFDMLREKTGAQRWIEYFIFSDLVSEPDRVQLNRLRVSKHAFVDDVGSTESFGRERASLQQVIRARIQKNEHWTFATIDSLKFDDGLGDFMKGRALTIYIDR
jgi:hypothetical protein